MKASDFAGDWALTRVITDYLSDQQSHLEGQAQLVPHIGGLNYHEEGDLSLPNGAVIKATREYHWAFEGGQVAVRFADGRPFHQFTPAGHAAGTDHHCSDDLYRVRYDFTRWPQWSARWQVTGPRKHYALTSCYSLQAAAPSVINPTT